MSHEGHGDHLVDVCRGIALVLLSVDIARRYLLAPEAYADDGFALTLLVRAPGLLAVVLLVFLLGFESLARRQRTAVPTLSRSLLLQGVVLVALELTLVRAVAWFTFDYTRAIGVLEVFWILGASMMVLAIFVHLTVRDVTVFAVVAVGWYFIVSGIEPPGRYGPGTAPGLAGQIWILLLGPAEIFRPIGTSGPVLGLIYPVLPFSGVAAAGYACGALYRTRIHAAWLRYRSAGGTPARLGRMVLATLGRVSLFCYVVQVLALHSVAVGVTAVAGRDVGYLFVTQPFEGRPLEGSGFGLGAVVGCWLAGMLISYAACRRRELLIACVGHA